MLAPFLLSIAGGYLLGSAINTPKFQKGGIIEIDDEMNVYYSKTINDDVFEISGRLRKYNTGRSDEYEFEPSWFSDEKSEKYYDENWESVEDEIIKTYYGTGN
jgi:hypothetical protein